MLCGLQWKWRASDNSPDIYAAAGIADHETVNRTFVTGRIQHVDYTVALCRLQNQTHTVLNNMALLINTAAEGCLWPRNNRFRNLLFHIDFLI